jgi:hypothetical protein
MPQNPPATDPRPLTTEPLAVDLVNTEWVGEGERHDLLVDLDGLRTWLHTAGLDEAPVDDAALRHVRTARAAIRAVLERHDDAGARARLNAVLDRGEVRSRLGDDGPVDVVEVADPSWRAAWLAAHDLLALLRDGRASCEAAGLERPSPRRATSAPGRCWVRWGRAGPCRAATRS